MLIPSYVLHFQSNISSSTIDCWISKFYSNFDCISIFLVSVYISEFYFWILYPLYVLVLSVFKTIRLYSLTVKDFFSILCPNHIGNLRNNIAKFFPLNRMSFISSCLPNIIYLIIFACLESITNFRKEKITYISHN